MCLLSSTKQGAIHPQARAPSISSCLTKRRAWPLSNSLIVYEDRRPGPSREEGSSIDDVRFAKAERASLLRGVAADRVALSWRLLFLVIAVGRVSRILDADFRAPRRAMAHPPIVVVVGQAVSDALLHLGPPLIEFAVVVVGRAVLGELGLRWGQQRVSDEDDGSGFLFKFLSPWRYEGLLMAGDKEREVTYATWARDPTLRKDRHPIMGGPPRE